MSDLSVSTDGLYIASTVISETAYQLIEGNNPFASSAAKASTAGAASVTAAIAAFNQAYSGRLSDRGRSLGAASATFSTTDDDGAAEIVSVSM